MKNDEHHDLERLLAGLEPPPPPAGLRVRAVAAARERMAAAPAPDLWTRIWNNRGLRLAWAAAVVLLLAGHALVSPHPGFILAQKAPVMADTQSDDQYLDILQPMQINADVHPTIGRYADAENPTQIEYGGNPS